MFPELELIGVSSGSTNQSYMSLTAVVDAGNNVTNVPHGKISATFKF